MADEYEEKKIQVRKLGEQRHQLRLKQKACYDAIKQLTEEVGGIAREIERMTPDDEESQIWMREMELELEFPEIGGEVRAAWR